MDLEKFHRQDAELTRLELKCEVDTQFIKDPVKSGEIVLNIKKYIEKNRAFRKELLDQLKQLKP